MAVEPHNGASLPDALVETNPLSDDPINEGDNHLRLLKITVVNFWTQYQAAVLGFDTRLTAVEGYATTGNADTLDGQHGAFYQNAANLNAGIIPAARLSGTYNINISGNAATATNATTANHATTADTATNADNATTLGGQTAAQLVQSQFPWYENSTLTVTTLGGMGVGSFNTQVGESLITVPPGGGFVFGKFSIRPRVSYSEPCKLWVDIRALPGNTLIASELLFEDAVVSGSQDVTSSVKSVNFIARAPAGTTWLRYHLRSEGGGQWHEFEGIGSTPKADSFSVYKKVI